MAVLRFNLLVVVIKLLSSGHTPLSPADVISVTTKCLHVDDISNIKKLFYFGHDLDELPIVLQVFASVVGLPSKTLSSYRSSFSLFFIACFSSLHAGRLHRPQFVESMRND